MSTTSENIKKFLETKDIAVAGVSRNNKKFGYKVFQLLKEQKYNIYPVNPNAKEIDGTQCYPSVSALPENVKALFVVTPKQHTNEVIREAIDKKMQSIWIQQKSDTPESLKLIKSNQIDLVANQCIFMHANPKGFHAFHGWLHNLMKK